MADFYCDHENTALYPSAYMSVPASAASLPQEGDGKASGVDAAPTVSSAAWNLTSASASAGTMTIMGATITGLTASGSALATAIATAINASTASAAAATNGNIASVYLKSLIWAVASGATLTVYSRIASADLNYANNTACQMATGTGWTTPPAAAQFSGGVSGPWRYLFNTTALTAAVSASVSTTVGLYGAMPATTMGSPVAGDTVHIRTKRAGANIVLTWPTVSCTVTSRAVGTVGRPLCFLTDNGIKWPGDAGVFIQTADGSLNVNRTMAVANSATNRQHWSGVNLTDSTRNWRHQITGIPVIGNYAYRIGAPVIGSSYIDISSMEATGAAGAAMNNANSAYPYFQITPGASNISPRDVPNTTLTDFVCKSAAKVSPITTTISTSFMALRQVKCLWDHTGCTQVYTEAMINTQLPSGGIGNWRYEAIGTRWIGFPAGANQSGWQNYAAKKCTVILRDCSFDNIKIFGGTANGGWLGTAEGAAPNDDILCSIQVVSTLGNRPFIYETFRKGYGWFDSAAPRTTGSVLPDGVTAFSLRTAVTSEAGNVTSQAPVLFPRMAKINSLADGDRTAQLRLLVDNNIITAIGHSPNNAEMFVTISYVGTDGLPKVVTTKAMQWATPVTLTAGTGGDWSATSYDVNGVSHAYTPYVISVALAGVKAGTELGLIYGQGCQSSSVDNYVFVDPEWSLA